MHLQAQKAVEDLQPADADMNVYVVTTLEDYGKGETPVEGSLRYGIEEFAKDKGGTMIVFNVGGTIELKQTLTFKEEKILP